jgi:predicted permease
VLYLLLVSALGAGAALQRHPHAERLRRSVWLANLWVLSPLLTVWAVATARPGRDVDPRALLAVFAATWFMVGAAFAYSRLVGRSRAERGALWLAAGFENAGYFGLPAAQLLYGHHGVKLAVLYSQAALGVPAIIVTTTIARLHGGHGQAGPGERPGLRALVRGLLANPVVAALALGLLLHLSPAAQAAVAGPGRAAAALVGPIGFLLFGLALPLGRVGLAASTMARGCGAICVRFALGPALLSASAIALGAHLPGVFLLCIACPTAMHVMTLARVYGVDPDLMRFVVVGSSLLDGVAVGALHLLH